jgi:hypothetical protein
VFCEVTCNFHGAIESLAVDGLVYQAFAFSITRREGRAHEDVHERGGRSDGSRQPLSADGAGKKSEGRLR